MKQKHCLRPERQRSGSSFTIFLGLLLTIAPTLSFACATTRGPRETAENYIQSEQAVLIWDEAHQIEHFIRQADISTKNPDLGFLVPTPNVPELVETDSRLFQLAADVSRPRLVREVISRQPLKILAPVLPGPLAIFRLPFVSLLSGMSNRNDPGLTIVSEQNIAGYHAVTLAADNAAALSAWLKQNNYTWTPELEAWLQPYLAARWTLTAFKLMRTNPENAASSGANKPLVTRAIRMTFATNRPFFPCSEPGQKQRAQLASPYGRALRVAFLGSQRMQGALENGQSWPGKLLFAGSPNPASGGSWTAAEWLSFAKLPADFPLPSTLTYWRDDSNPRPGIRDLYFSPSGNQSPFRKTEIDYSAARLHRLDLGNLLSDVAALLMVLLLPGAPLYCGYQLMQASRHSNLSAKAALPTSTHNPILRRLLGFTAILMGGFYGVGCLVITYLLHDLQRHYGYPLPLLCLPIVTLGVGAIFLISIDCGVQIFRPQTPSVTAPLPTAAGRFWNYLTASFSLLIGGAFAFALIVVFIGNFFD